MRGGWAEAEQRGVGAAVDVKATAVGACASTIFACVGWGGSRRRSVKYPQLVLFLSHREAVEALKFDGVELGHGVSGEVRGGELELLGGLEVLAVLEAQVHAVREQLHRQRCRLCSSVRDAAKKAHRLPCQKEKRVRRKAVENAAQSSKAEANDGPE